MSSPLSGIPIWAVPGAKVVCVDASRWRSTDVRTGYLRLHRIYVIEAAEQNPPPDNRCGFFLVGAHAIDCAGDRIAYDARRFRPATERKTQAEDLAVFRDLLTNPVSVGA